MKNKLLFIFSCFLATTVAAQPTITDVASCSSYTLSASVVGGLPTDIGLYSDDSYSDVINIGFNFNFYGTVYTQCVIGENGQLSFNLSNATGYDDWDIQGAGSPLLGNSDCFNAISGPWVDLYGLANPPYSPVGSPIYTSLQGVAPNRTFAVTWCAVPMFLWGSFCTDQFVTTQIILYETSNLVEVHIGNYVNCPAWDGGYAITGVENASGTQATAAPGEDYPTIWSATNTAWRFTPDAALATYGVTSIPYAPIPYSTATIYWYDSTTGAYLGSGSPIVFTPSVNTTYEAAALGCSDTSKSYITVVGITPGSGGGGAPVIENITSTNPTVCGLSNGVITLYGISPGFIDTIFETIGGVPQPPFIDSANADSTITFTGLSPVTYSFYYKINTCPSNVESQTLVSPPPINATFTYVVQLGCNGDEVYLTNTSSPAGYSSSWDFGDGTTSTATSPSHIYADGSTGTGTYVITLTYESYGDPACATSSSQTVTFDHPLVASFTSDQDTICLGVPITFTNYSIANSPSYLWDFGDGTTDVTTNPTHTYAAGGVYNVTLTVTDTIPCTATATEPIDVISIDVHTGVHDTSVCLTDSMALRALVNIGGAIDSVAYMWTPTNNIGEPTDSVTNFMGIGDYTYLVTVTTGPAACTASDTETIHSYAPVTLFDLTTNQTIAYGSSIQLNANGAVYYTWTPNDGTLNNPNINNPVATPIDSITTYTVYGMNLYGCLDSASLIVTLTYTTPEVVPSAFTPNNDGLNDVFRVKNLGTSKLVDFRVFNRWGQAIFQTANAEVGWDGNFNGVPQDIGTYNYEIIIAHTDGTQKTFTGSVTLIR